MDEPKPPVSSMTLLYVVVKSKEIQKLAAALRRGSLIFFSLALGLLSPVFTPKGAVRRKHAEM